MGRRFSPNNSTKNATFPEFFSSPFTITESNTTTYHSSGDTLCHDSSFEGADPLPGVQKACYCDVDGKMFDEDYVHLVKDYWRSREYQNDMNKTLIKIQAEVEQYRRDLKDL